SSARSLNGSGSIACVLNEVRATITSSDARAAVLNPLPHRLFDGREGRVRGRFSIFEAVSHIGAPAASSQPSPPSQLRGEGAASMWRLCVLILRSAEVWQSSAAARRGCF